MSDDPLKGHWGPFLALLLFTLASLGLGVLANRVTAKKAGFLEKYFLGNRSMGAIAVALTAAVMSGGSFLGFPSLVYSFGWVVGLWICSYMIAPMTILGILGKRIGQVSRKTGAITLPDLFRERFDSPGLGLLTSLLVMVFLTAFLVAQFKGGAVIMKIVLPRQTVGWFAVDSGGGTGDTGYYVGLAIFATTVIAYTAYGGFLAAIWTDVFQSLVMAAGVLILFPLAMAKSWGLNAGTMNGMAQAGPGFAFGPGANRDFHPIGLAFSFFVMWAIVGMGQPSTLVRLMAFRDSRTLRYSILYQTFYNALIYVPLIFIFVAARGLLPGLSAPDEVMPRLVVHLANPFVAGFILAAPYGAVMSTVSGFLLIVSSGLVRDLYQRFVRPGAGERELIWASYGATVLVGLVVTVLSLNPPKFLQLIVVFASAGTASAFLAPAVFTAFWRRATAPGAIAAMLCGSATVVGLYVLGSIGPERLGVAWLVGENPPIGVPASFRPFYLGGLDPCIWGLLASFSAGIAVSLVTTPPDARRVSLLFDAPPSPVPIPDHA